MVEKKALHFTIEGEYITALAREKLFEHKDLAAAIRILRSALCSDQLSSDEQLMLCLQILHGAASIKGNSGTNEYGVEIRNDIETRPTDLSTIAQLITDMKAENEQLKKKNNDIAIKFSYLCDQLSSYQLTHINNEYYGETGEHIFSDKAVSSCQIPEKSNDMLESYLAQRRRRKKAEANGEELECDYGWLEPDGTFHSLPWGEHARWASKWLNEHMPYKEHPKIYWYIHADGTRHHITDNDVLIYSLGWILLNSPYQGLAKMTKDKSRQLTKAQKEFLYDYFIKRGRMDEANALYKD